MEQLLKPTFWFFSVIDPWYWVLISFSLSVFFLIGVSPTFSSSQVNEEYKIRVHLGIKMRQLAWFNLLFVCVLMPTIIFVMGFSGSRNSNAYTSIFFDELLNSVSNLWVIPALASLVSFSISWITFRVLKPKWSALKRRWRVRQTGEELSDIRAEQNKIKTKNFLPTKHYYPGKFFWGLTTDDLPIYDDFEIWNTRHFRLVGPTQTGKGVELGVVLDQIIRHGNTVFFVDSKPDKHARSIMKAACEKTGRRFIELDLRPEGKGRYEPFLGGDPRHARKRLAYILGLQDTGTDGDFYKSQERKIIDEIFNKWDRRLYSLRDILSGDKYSSDTTRSLNYINEWLQIPTFRVDRNKRGFAVDKCFENNAVVYIRGDLDDDVINKACTVLLMEICQECKRLYESGVKQQAATLLIDEVAFLINEQLADALATVAGFDMNIGLAYQSEGDLLNLKDKTLNSDAIATRVKVNCKNSMYYMAADAETAKVMAEESGEIFKSVTRSQSVKVGRHLEETWEEKRDIHKVDEHLITANQARMLPERVGVLYRPNTLAEICHTCWIPVEVIKEESAKLRETLEPNTLAPEHSHRIVEDLPAIPAENQTEKSDKIDLSGAKKIRLELDL